MSCRGGVLPGTPQPDLPRILGWAEGQARVTLPHQPALLPLWGGQPRLGSPMHPHHPQLQVKRMVICDASDQHAGLL